MRNNSLTVRQAADSAARNPSTIRRWIQSGKLRGTKVGSRYAVDAADLDRLLESDVLPLSAVEQRTRGLNRSRIPSAPSSRPRSTAFGSRYGMVPGWELVSAGLSDLRAGRESIEALLVVSAAERLRTVGINVPGRWRDDVPERLYTLVVGQVGEGPAHSLYNALRRRLASFLRAAQPHRASGS